MIFQGKDIDSCMLIAPSRSFEKKGRLGSLNSEHDSEVEKDVGVKMESVKLAEYVNNLVKCSWAYR